MDTTAAVVLNCFQLQSLATFVTLWGELSEKSAACLTGPMKKVLDETSGEFRCSRCMRWIEWIRFMISTSCAELRDLCELHKVVLSLCDLS